MKTNFLRTLKVFKPLTWQNITLSAGIFLVLIGSGVFALSSTIHNNQLAAEQARQTKLAEEKRRVAQQEEAARKLVEQTKKEEAAQAESTQSKSASSTPQIKYSTSSDPRSTAYSLTPPQPNASSISNRITYAGQLKDGDLVFYNATKGERGYYNGDLLISPAVVTISRSAPAQTPVAISSPTSRLISMASTPWYERNPNFGIAYDSAASTAPALSHDMVVVPFNMPEAGLYTLHITVGCDWPTGDSCQSDGFITIHVVE